MNLDRVHDLVQRQSVDLPGGYAAIAVGRADGPIASAAFVRGEPVDPAPRSPIASLTKPITATAIMQLSEAGAIDLDEPIASYVAEFRPEPPGDEPDAAPVTIRHLLSHTSGMSDLPDEVLVTLPPTPAAMLDAMCGQRLMFAPGSAFQYASEPWYLLSAIIERVGSMPYPSFIRDRILAPLGMRLTTFDPRDPGADHLMPAGHFPSADLGADDVLALMAGLTMPGGGLWSTPDDIVRFGRAMLLGGALDGARVLERRTLETMTEPQTSGLADFGSGEPVHYGLGWGLRPAGASASAFAHSGATGSILIVDPEADIVIVHLRNWWGVAMDATTETIEAVYASLDG